MFWTFFTYAANKAIAHREMKRVLSFQNQIKSYLEVKYLKRSGLNASQSSFFQLPGKVKQEMKWNWRNYAAESLHTIKLNAGKVLVKTAPQLGQRSKLVWWTGEKLVLTSSLSLPTVIRGPTQKKNQTNPTAREPKVGGERQTDAYRTCSDLSQC